MKQILPHLCWLLSPTRKIIDCCTNNNLSPVHKGKKLRNWNKSLFLFEIFLLFILTISTIIQPSLTSLICPLSKWLLMGYAFSRCNEISYALGKDVFSRLNNEIPTSNLTSVMRVAMAMRSYVGLIINFAFIYYLLPSISMICGFFKESFFNKAFDNFFESIYFSVVTLTTLGYGDFLPQNWLSQLFVIYEVLVGILLIVVVIATYIGGVSSVQQGKSGRNRRY